jgi:uncharacterized phiE125 gp8 family phage protein
MLMIETQPVVEPITIDDAKAQLRLTTTVDDDMLTRLVKAARIRAERITGRSLTYKGYLQTFDSFPSPRKAIVLQAPPLISVTSIEYLDDTLTLQTWDPSEYRVITKQVPGLIRAIEPNVFPVAACHMEDAVQVHFFAGYSIDGYGDTTQLIPEDLQIAIAQLAAHWYDHPEMVSADNQNKVPGNLMDTIMGYKIYG